MIEIYLRKCNTDFNRAPLPTNAIALASGGFAVIEYRDKHDFGLKCDWRELGLSERLENSDLMPVKPRDGHPTVEELIDGGVKTASGIEALHDEMTAKTKLNPPYEVTDAIDLGDGILIKDYNSESCAISDQGLKKSAIVPKTLVARALRKILSDFFDSADCSDR